MSTYNGERYLPEQLDSLLRQVGVDVHILIRDDGSKDSTLRILEEYSREYSNINYYAGVNKGVIASFNDLLERPELEYYDYIAFCDQDDVWDEDKILIAVSNIEKFSDIPAMYCSNLLLADEQLHLMRSMRKPVKQYTESMAMVQNIGTGCTQVFNKKALELYRKGIGCRMEMHDYWLTLVCIFMGKIIYDENAHIRYRQHKNNVVGAKNTKVVSAVAHITKQKKEVRVPMLKDFSETYSIPYADGKCIQEVLDYRNSFLCRMKLLRFKYRGLSNKTTIGFKIRAIVGKMY